MRLSLEKLPRLAYEAISALEAVDGDSESLSDEEDNVV